MDLIDSQPGVTPSGSADFDPFASGELERVCGTTEAQREVWLADRLGPEASIAFNESTSLWLRGPLDGAALRLALQDLVARHESLRATFGSDGQQMLVGTAQPLELPTKDLSPLGHQAVQRALDEALAAAVDTPFDLQNGPLFRVALYRTEKNIHLLLMTAHHIVCDGWSWGVICSELGSLYAARIGATRLSLEPAEQYSDYVACEAAEAAGPAMAEHLNYWVGQFAGGTPPVLELPLDRTRAANRSFASRRIDHRLDALTVDAARRLAASTGVSLFTSLFGAFAVLLHRLSGQDDLVIGVPAAGQSSSDMPSLVGHCVNLLPIRLAVPADQPFEAMLRQAGGALLDAFEHQTLTYGALLRRLPVQRDPSRLPLVSVMFNLDSGGAGIAESFPGLRTELVANPRSSENFELFVNAVPVADGVRLECQYNTSLYDAATIRRWLELYESILRAAVAAPERAVGRLEWLDAAGLEQVRSLMPAPTSIPQPELMHGLVLRQCASTPTRTALSCGALRLDYHGLEQRSNRLSRALRERGIHRGSRVGLCLTRGIDMVVALLAVLKAGGSYVPLDPGFPQARLDYYAEDAQLALLVTESTLAVAPRQWCNDASERILELDLDVTWHHESPEPLASSPLDAGPEDAAYAIYTSGSTGKPKGVSVPHRAVANFLHSMRSSPGIHADDRLAAVTTLSFDIAVLELMLPLTAGAEVVIVEREVAMDGGRLRALLETRDVTLMQATPGLWRVLVEAEWHGSGRFKVLVGGESLPPDLARDLLTRSGEVWNLYGPTETTVWSTLWRVDAESMRQRGVSIGRPIENTSVWVLDEHGQPCPVGVPGEICIGGRGVALGYLGRPELTAERFIDDRLGPPGGSRLYRTGDRGRWCNDGLLQHLGRLDFQVKLRGYRIELGEIESCCNEVAGVASSVVMVRDEQTQSPRLVAYIARSNGISFDEAQWRVHLRSRLPDYMVPPFVVVLDALPLLPNGKVDRKALPAPGARASTARRERVAPRSPLEAQVLAAFEAVLSLPGLGVEDDFFSMGGHSLLAARLITRLNRDLGLALPLRTVFEAPSAARLARAVEASRGSLGHRPEPVIEHDATRRRAPLTPMQERVRFVTDLDPRGVLYNTPSAHRLTGKLDFASFKRALAEIVRRQAVLRTCVAVDPTTRKPVQHIAESIDVELPLVDLGRFAQDEREPELMRRMRAIVDTPQDIYRAPLFRATLYRLSDNEHVFLFVPHHLVWDGWSFDILYQEMTAIYGAFAKGKAHDLPPLRTSYADYAQWQEHWLQGRECAEQLRRWVERYSTLPPTLSPRTDHPRRIGSLGGAATTRLQLSAIDTEALRAIARDADVTMNMLALGLYAVVLAGAIGSPHVVLGTPVRGRLRIELEPVMGFFINVLPLQLHVDANLEFGAFLRHVKRESLEVMSLQEVPFDRLAAEPEIAARLRRSSVYQSLFSFQDTRARTRDWGDLAHDMVPLFQKGATDDLGLWLLDSPQGLDGGITYNVDVYEPESAACLHDRYLEVLRQVCADPTLRVQDLMALNTPLGIELHRRLAPLPQALPDPVKTAEPAPPAVVSPAPPTRLTADEATMAGIWSELLGIDAAMIRATDSFFDVGGESLLAMRAVERCARALGFRVEPRRYLYETLAQLALRDTTAASPKPQAPARHFLGRVLSAFGKRP